ncbi:hypothetical protein HHK36_022594 [Tetracentron sinense]|uniref:Uncharacterized protein n=1 Tax=Tetracentron sinense TaxID=13715 RepID=A0A835D8Z5_TETSI|nr:hypothetical protein HHK36_022594 [Tetracentron sinense]
MAFECAGKNSWPELLGTQGHVAAATIERENPLVTAEIVLEGTIVPADLVPWSSTYLDLAAPSSSSNLHAQNRTARLSSNLGKNSWPELLGTQGYVTAARIEKENPLVTAEIVIEGTIVPADFVPV